MRILLASSEAHPYSKTGGLADMVSALAKALARSGNHVGLVTPLFAGIRERFTGLQPGGGSLDFPLGHRRVSGEVWTLEPEPNLTIYFIDQPDFYQRAQLYQKDGVDYPDNADRFIFFSKAAAHLAAHLPWKPEVLHAHDWQAAPAILFLRDRERSNPGQGTPRTCLTIHNLAYQGVFPASQYVLTNLSWDYFTPAGAEFYGQMNALKTGIALADKITTVSPRYAREITTEEFGCGLDGLLRSRLRDLTGILNGVDYDEWNTTHNPFLPHAYSATHPGGKALNKAALQAEFGLPVDARAPLFGNISRMVEQKGTEILRAALDEVLGLGIQFVQLGSGAPAQEWIFQALARRFSDQAAVRIGFDQGASHRIEAGCDFYLMPSRFEPCGLNQLYSLRYGAIPIVRAVGGLDDSVADIRDQQEAPDGIKFHEYSGRALAKAIRKALALYAEPALFRKYRENGMRKDFSWSKTAAEYEAVYQRIRETSNPG